MKNNKEQDVLKAIKFIIKDLKLSNLRDSTIQESAFIIYDYIIQKIKDL